MVLVLGKIGEDAWFYSNIGFDEYFFQVIFLRTFGKPNQIWLKPCIKMDKNAEKNEKINENAEKI